MGNQTSTQATEVNSHNLAKSIEDLLKGINNDAASDTIGFKRNESSVLSDLHVQTIQELLQSGGYLNVPERKRYADVQFGKGTNENVFMKKSAGATNYDADMSVDTESIYKQLKDIVGGHYGTHAGNLKGGTLDSDTNTVDYKAFIKHTQTGGNKADDGLVSICSESFDNDIISNKIRSLINEKTQTGGNNSEHNSELTSISGENMDTLKNIIMGHISQQKGGRNVIAQQENDSNLYSSISEGDLKKLRSMVLRKNTHKGGSVFSTPAPQPVNYKNLGLSGKSVNGNVFSATSSAQVGGMVGGNVYSATSSVPVDGMVGGNVYSATSSVSVDGMVGGNVYSDTSSVSVGQLLWGGKSKKKPVM